LGATTTADDEQMYEQLLDSVGCCLSGGKSKTIRLRLGTGWPFRRPQTLVKCEDDVRRLLQNNNPSSGIVEGGGGGV